MAMPATNSGLCKRILKRLMKDNLRCNIWIIGLYSLTFIIVLPLVCYDRIYSSYYISDLSRRELEDKALKINAHYAAEAKDYLSNLKPSLMNEFSEDKQGVDMAVGIVTVPRQLKSQKLNYLTQTFAKLHQSIQQDSERSLHTKVLFICNVFAGPGNHTEVQGLRPFVHVSERFPSNNPAAVIMDRFDKEKEDYAYCIDVAIRRYHPKYILIVEDDALPYANIFEVIQVILDTLLEYVSFDGYIVPNREEWAYLKLYYPERWKGYAFEVIPLLELTGMGLVGGSVFVWLGFLCTKNRITQRSTLTQFTWGFTYLVLVSLVVGRQYLIEWRRISKFTYTVVPAPDCCSPAILYTARKAKKLSAYLKTITCTASFPIDYAMDKFVRNNGYKKFLIEPNLVEHIGMLSSIKTWSDRPQDFIHRPE